MSKKENSGSECRRCRVGGSRWKVVVEGNVGGWTARVDATMMTTKTCKSSHAKAFLRVMTSAHENTVHRNN